MRSWSRAGAQLALLLPPVALLCSGCIVLKDRWPVAFESHGRDSRRPYITIWIEGEGSMNGVPWVFEHYVYDPPFDLRLKYTTHNVVTNAEIRFEDVTLHFPDGTRTNLTTQVRERMRLGGPYENHFTAFAAPDYKPVSRTAPCLEGSVTFERLLPKRMPFTLTLKGTVWSEGKLVESFDAELNSDLKRRTKVMHKLKWLAWQSV